MLLEKIYFIILLSVHIARATNFISPNISVNSDISEISQCIVDIVRNNRFYKPTISIYNNNIQSNKLHDYIATKIIDVFVQNTIPIIYMTNNNNNTNHVYYGTLIEIIYIDNCKSLTGLAGMKVDGKIKYIVILHNDVISNCKNSLQKTGMNLTTYDVTYIYKGKDNKYKLATFIPILDATTCKSVGTILFTPLNISRNGAIDEVKINAFPKKKPKDLMRCPLNVGMGALYPYVTTYNNTLPNLHPLKFVNGSDVEIMKIVANYFNASLNLYHIRTDPENIFLELSFMTLLVNGSLDVCAGGLYRIFGDIVAYSGIYSRQDVIWVYTVERLNRSWISFIHKIDGLYIFLLFYFCYSALWIAFCYFDKQTISLSNTVLYGWGALFGAASLQEPRTLKKKMLNMLYLVLCLHLSAYVSTQLYSFLTIQRPPYVYKDTNEISKSGRPLYMKNKAKYFVEDEKYMTFANTSYNCNDFIDCLTKTLNNKGITAILNGLFAPVQTATAKNDEARILKVTEAILVVYHEMLIRKESLLVGNFNKVIGRLFEAGICQKLYEDAIGILVIDKARRTNKNILANSYSCEAGCIISLSDCAGAFYVLIFGSVISSCVFYAEIVIGRKRKHTRMSTC